MLFNSPAVALSRKGRVEGVEFSHILVVELVSAPAADYLVSADHDIGMRQSVVGWRISIPARVGRLAVRVGKLATAATGFPGRPLHPNPTTILR